MDSYKGSKDWINSMIEIYSDTSVRELDKILAEQETSVIVEVNNKRYLLQRSYTSKTYQQAENRSKELSKNYVVFGIRRSEDKSKRFTVTYGKEL